MVIVTGNNSFIIAKKRKRTAAVAEVCSGRERAPAEDQFFVLLLLSLGSGSRFRPGDNFDDEIYFPYCPGNTLASLLREKGGCPSAFRTKFERVEFEFSTSLKTLKLADILSSFKIRKREAVRRVSEIEE